MSNIGGGGGNLNIGGAGAPPAPTPLQPIHFLQLLELVVHSKLVKSTVHYKSGGSRSPNRAAFISPSHLYHSHSQNSLEFWQGSFSWRLQPHASSSLDQFAVYICNSLSETSQHCTASLSALISHIQFYNAYSAETSPFA